MREASRRKIAQLQQGRRVAMTLGFAAIHSHWRPSGAFSGPVHPGTKTNRSADLYPDCRIYVVDPAADPVIESESFASRTAIRPSTDYIPYSRHARAKL